MNPAGSVEDIACLTIGRVVNDRMDVEQRIIRLRGKGGPRALQVLRRERDALLIAERILFGLLEPK